MLQVSRMAAEVLQREREEAGLPAEAGVRLRSDVEGAERIIRFAFQAKAETSDHTVEQAGLRLFVAADLAELLANCTLDAEATPAGMQLIICPR